MRRLKSFLGLTAGEGAWRVVIVDAADELNPNAANALLKSLEEPPPRALFLLVTSEPSRLLPTIRSRCRRLDLQPLDAQSLRQARDGGAGGRGAEGAVRRQVAALERLAEGSVRRALQLATGGIDLYERIEAHPRPPAAVDWPALHTLADPLAPAPRSSASRCSSISFSTRSPA